MNGKPSQSLSPGLGRRLALITIAAAIVHACGLGRPLIDRHDWATTHQAQFGRNHVRYGLSVTKTRCMYSVFQQDIDWARKFYPDHPPLLSLALAASMKLIGIRDEAVRLVPAVCTIAAIALTASLASYLVGRTVGLIAGAVMLALPLPLFLGRVACHETLVLPFWLLALRGYLGWTYPERFGNRPRRDAALYAAGTILALISGWVAFLQATVIGLHFVYTVVRRTRRATVGAWLLVVLPAVVAGAATFTHILWSFQWNYQRVLGLFFYRSGVKEGENPFGVVEWLDRQADWLMKDFTVTGLLFGVIGVAAAVIVRSAPPTRAARRKAGKRRQRDAGGAVASAANLGRDPSEPSILRWSGLLAAGGLLFVLIFRNGSFEHEYWWLHVLPFAAVLIAQGLWRAANGAGRIGRVVGYGVLAAGIVGIAAESAAGRSAFFIKNSSAALGYQAAEYINRHTSERERIYGNRNLWVSRTYFEGPVGFLHPQFSWYLDRDYRPVSKLESIQRIAPRCRYYLWIGRSAKSRKLAEALMRIGTIRARWEHAIVFDLTRPPDAAEPASVRRGGRTP